MGARGAAAGVSLLGWIEFQYFNAELQLFIVSSVLATKRTSRSGMRWWVQQLVWCRSTNSSLTSSAMRRMVHCSCLRTRAAGRYVLISNLFERNRHFSRLGFEYSLKRTLCSQGDIPEAMQEYFSFATVMGPLLWRNSEQQEWVLVFVVATSSELRLFDGPDSDPGECHFEPNPVCLIDEIPLFTVEVWVVFCSR